MLIAQIYFTSGINKKGTPRPTVVRVGGLHRGDYEPEEPGLAQGGRPRPRAPGPPPIFKGGPPGPWPHFTRTGSRQPGRERVGGGRGGARIGGWGGILAAGKLARSRSISANNEPHTSSPTERPGARKTGPSNVGVGFRGLGFMTALAADIEGALLK